MNFDLTEEQALMKGAVERFAGQAYGGDIERRRGYQAGEHGFSAANWQTLGELGVLALPLGEEFGLGGGLVELMTAHEALGRGLVVEPVLESAVIAAGLIDAAGTAEQRAAWLPGLADGSKRIALAHAERAARYNLEFVETRARDGALSGEKSFVLRGPGADAFIVSAEDGLYLVRADAAGLARRDFRVVDGGWASELTLRDVPGEKLAGGLAALHGIVARANIAACGELLGLMGLLLDTTLDYVRQRTQFGSPLASFQALQHRLVDAYAALEQARSMTVRAALMPSAATAAGAKAFVAEKALAMGHTAIQLHGGMGMTDELAVGHAHKRVVLLAHLFGDPEAELARSLAA